MEYGIAWRNQDIFLVQLWGNDVPVIVPSRGPRSGISFGNLELWWRVEVESGRESSTIRSVIVDMSRPRYVK